MIPFADLDVGIPDPLPPARMPGSDELSDDGFGGFRNTWFLGRVPSDEAAEIVTQEARLIAWLDDVAQTGEEFEALALTLESSELADMPEKLRSRATDAGLESVMSAPDDLAPLDGLEIGVAGLAHALSAIGCLTAASCRSHVSDLSWSDCPIVFFASPAWRLQVVAEMIAATGCGLGTSRGLLTVYAPSIREMHRLAGVILQARRRFSKRPTADAPSPRSNPSSHASA